MGKKKCCYREHNNVLLAFKVEIEQTPAVANIFDTFNLLKLLPTKFICQQICL